jgi:hypothetical protein
MDIFDNTKFFSGTKPKLINEKALKSIDKLFDNNAANITMTNEEHLFKIFETYIKPNLFPIVIVIIISIYLFIRYFLKKYNEENLIIDSDFDQNNDIDYTDPKKLFLIENNDDLNNRNNINNNIDIDTNNDNFDIDSIDDDTNNSDISRFTELNEEYNKAIRENSGLYSDQYIKDTYKKKKDKMSFDELTRILVEGGGNK